MAYGRNVLTNNVILPTRVSFDGSPEYKAGGITIDWSTVTAVSADTTLPDGSIVRNGNKYLRYGQVVTRMGAAEVQTYTWTGGATAGSAILTLPAVGDQPAQSTAAIAFDATGAVATAAIEALGRIGANNVVVARTGAGSAGDPYIYTATYNRNMGNVPALTASHTFTGGTTPTVTVATTTSGGTTSGYFGPFDSAASDGRQTLTQGDAFVLDYTILQYSINSGLSVANDQVGGAIAGGQVWRERIIQSNAVTQSLALGPTFANLVLAIPNLIYVKD